MKTSAVICIVALCFASLAMAAPAAVTVKGEVVDTMCFSAMGARGESHAKCGLACAKAGIPVGLVEGKKMYILLPAKDGQSLPSGLIEKMGHEVSVTGDVYQSGGNTFLTVQSFK